MIWTNGFFSLYPDFVLYRNGSCSMEENLKRCEWCDQDCRALAPLENRDCSFLGLFVWVCDGCREAMRDEYWCEAFCAPIVVRLHRQRSAGLAVRQLTEFMECVL